MKDLEKIQVSDNVQKLITEEKTRVQATINPRDGNNLGAIAFKHPKYDLGEERISDPIDWLEDRLKLQRRGLYTRKRMRYLEKFFLREYVGLRVYLYDHSGITISTSPFKLLSSSGQVGYIYTDKKQIKETLRTKRVTQKVRKRVKEFLQHEIEAFDNYIRVNPHEFIIENEQKETVKIDDGLNGGDLSRNGMKVWMPKHLNSQSGNAENQVKRGN